MINAKKKLTPDDRKRIIERIAALERTTDAEVVCAVATESGRYDRAECYCGLLVGLSALIIGNKLTGLGSWDSTISLSLGLQVFLMAGGFAVGSILASYWHPARMLLVSRREMKREVKRSVNHVFTEAGIGATRHRGGVLIYLSLFERQLEVRCDRSVAAVLSEAELGAIRDAVLDKVRSGDFTAALIAGLDRVEHSLARALPSSTSSPDALPNDLLLFHPRP